MSRKGSLLLFDVDGTLAEIDEARPFLAAFRQVYDAEVDTCWDGYRLRTDIGIAKEVLERHLGHSPSPEEICRALDLFVVLMRAQLSSGEISIRSVGGVEEVLPVLSDKGFALGLATGCIEQSARLKLVSLGLDRYFPCGGFAEDSDFREDILREAIARARAYYGATFSAEEVLFLGDRAWDVQSARTVGTRFIGISSSEERTSELRDAGAPTVISSYGDLMKFL